MQDEIRIDAEGDLVEVHVRGRLVKEDHERLVPELERRIRDHGPLRVLVVLRDLGGSSAGALLKELPLDAVHFDDIVRLALVSDDDVIRDLAGLSPLLTSAEVECFSAERIEEAREWVADGAGPNSPRRR